MIKILSVFFILLASNSYAITENTPIYTSHNGEWYGNYMTERGECYNGNCYIIYEGNNSDNAYMSTYNGTTKTWDSGALVGVNPLSGDAHGNPAMLIDCNGRIHAFYGAHNTAGLEHRMSTNPEDTSTWTTMTDVGTLATYPQAFLHSNCDIELFYRESRFTGAWSTILSTDDGATWSSPVSILNQNGIPNDDFYATANLDSQDRLHINFTLETGSPNTRINNYYIYRDGSTQGSTYRYIDGSAMTLPITKNYANANCRIETTTENHGTTKPVFDTSDNPILLLDNTSTDGGSKIAKWNGSSWSFTTVDAAGGTIELFIDSDEVLYVFDRSGFGTADGYQLEVYVSNDYGDSFIRRIKTLNDFDEQPAGFRTFKNPNPILGAWFTYSNSPNNKIWAMTKDEFIESGYLNKTQGISGVLPTFN